MINELKKLADSMAKSGISAKQWNRHFKPIKGTGDQFVLSISKDGQITRIRHLEKEDVQCLRTWGISNGETFPAFNFMPFYRLDDSLSKGKKEEKMQAMSAVLDCLEQNSTPAAQGIQETDRKAADKTTERCLGRVAEEFFRIVNAGEPENPMFSTFRDSQKKLVELEGITDTVPLVFQRKLLAYFSREMNAGTISGTDDPRLSILFDLHGKVVLFFDVEDPEPEYVASRITMDKINEKLEQANRKEETAGSSVTDAFGNLCDPAELDEKMPSVKLPGKIAETHLRSMANAIPCQTRYGTIDAQSFPAGNQIRTDAKASLEWISDQERNGQTWTSAGESEILFAYPKELPQINIPIYLARMLGNGRGTEQRFINCAKDTIQQLTKLHTGELQHVDIEIFAIKYADKARRKVVFYRNYDAEHLRLAVESWNAGAANIQDISIRSWLPKDKTDKDQKAKPVQIQFDAPYPLAVMREIYTVWSQDGNAKTTPKCRGALMHDNVPVFDGLELFLGESVKTGLVQRCISMILQNGMPLFLALKNTMQKREVVSSGMIPNYLAAVLPVIGILQFKLNIKKEFYMNESPYLLGKMLTLADGLHKRYCEEVRGGDIPPELLGSTFYVQTANHPNQAFGSLGIRMQPYLKWAKTTKDGLAHWYMKEFSIVSDALEQNGIPERLTDADKAQLLLGYLGSLKAKDETLNTTNTQEE